MNYECDIAHLLHYTPADMDSLTVEQMDRACQWVDAYVAAAKKGS